MRPIKNCAWKVFLENQESFGNQESIINFNHELSENKKYDLESSKYLNGISTRKWQIMLTSADCTIKKHCPGWQIYLKNVKGTEGKEFAWKLSDTNMNSRVNVDTVKTANAEILCNRDDLDDLLREYEKQNEQAHGRIILRDYLKLLSNEEIKVNFILKVLTKAVNDHKIFVIYGNFPVLRKPLGKRGWIEKRFIRRLLSTSLEMSEAGLETIERLLRCPADFIWYTNKKAGARTDERTIVNKFSGCYFTSKVDMCNNLENVCWYYESGVSNIQFPRCYNVYQAVQIQEFIQDFYITACMGILKWFVLLAGIAGPNNAWSSNGTVPIKALLFALERCAEYISICEHEDIDGQKYRNLSSSDWALFLVWHEQLLHRHEILQKNQGLDIEELLRFTVNTLREMTRRRPQSHIDGMRNVWILKPGDKSLGRGILLKSSLKGILSKIHQTTKECMQYVIQKYIERPLLVHKTKVDVRQWFLITSTQPLIVWMDILLRFASKDFTLKSFHESIHLCNTTVQLKYRKTVKQYSQIPSELHWNLQKFKEYLKTTNRESAWERVIEPGIKQNLIGALLASQENMVNRKNSFQLYGADFLIMDDLSVWLIEINTNPRLHPPSSSVTEKLYPEVIEDTMKVILDRRKNKKATRGKFECIFKQRNPFHGHAFGKAASLGIRGKALFSTQGSLRK
ncbi:tubulin glycylase 3A-like isoform X2 [Osmia lignaria lignaria]|uniref:tubulin glycylase 3A-like isoform X2 n=1 Tax=Osmia lignaria lignaria TaxID=1437193 RepID=UPI00402B967B